VYIYYININININKYIYILYVYMYIYMHMYVCIYKHEPAPLFPQLCSTALGLFNGMELCGREMKIARPSGYEPTAGAPAPPLGMPSGLAAGLPPTGMGLLPLGGTLSPDMVALGAAAAADKPMPTRELCLDNLLSASVLADPVPIYRYIYIDT